MKTKFLSIAIALTLAACGGGGDEESKAVEAPKINSAEYSVAGSIGKAMVTYHNAQGGTSQELVTLPWKKSIFSSPGSFLYISAQSQDSIGSFTVGISANGNVLKSSTSSGAYAIATASTNCCK